MGEWAEVELGSLAASKNGAIAIGPFGSAMKADTYTKSGVPVIRGTNISDSRAWKGDWVYISNDFADSMPRCVVKAGELVFPHRGAIGEVALVPQDAQLRYFLSTSLMKIELDKKKACPLFVYYYFRSRAGRDEIMKYSSQVGTPGIGQPLASLRSFKVPAPPLPVQESIASILGALDDKIDLNRQMNETLEAMARAIFKDWFVDFGPTRAKAEGRAPYLADDLWSLFPGRLDSDGKPEGWRPDKLGNICSRVAIGPFGSNITTDNFVDHGVPVIRGGNLKAGFIDSEFVYLTNEKAEELKNAIALPQDIVITHRGTLGQVGIIPDGARFQKYIISQSQMLLRIDASKASPRFAFEFLRSNVGMQQLLAFTSQTGVPAIARPTTSLKSLEIIMPNRIVISEFDKIISPLIEMESRNTSESRTLAQTRDLLLPKLMSGDIRIRDAENLVENAL